MLFIVHDLDAGITVAPLGQSTGCQHHVLRPLDAFAPLAVLGAPDHLFGKRMHLREPVSLLRGHRDDKAELCEMFRHCMSSFGFGFHPPCCSGRTFPPGASRAAGVRGAQREAGRPIPCGGGRRCGNPFLSPRFSRLHLALRSLIAPILHSCRGDAGDGPRKKGERPSTLGGLCPHVCRVSRRDGGCGEGLGPKAAQKFQGDRQARRSASCAGGGAGGKRRRSCRRGTKPLGPASRCCQAVDPRASSAVPPALSCARPRGCATRRRSSDWGCRRPATAGA